MAKGQIRSNKEKKKPKQDKNKKTREQCVVLCILLGSVRSCSLVFLVLVLLGFLLFLVAAHLTLGHDDPPWLASSYESRTDSSASARRLQANGAPRRHAPGPERQAVLFRMDEAARGHQDATVQQRVSPDRGSCRARGLNDGHRGVGGGRCARLQPRLCLWHITVRCVYGQILQSREMVERGRVFQADLSLLATNGRYLLTT